MSSTEKTPPSSLATYQHPQTGLLSTLPRQWVPYAELMRLATPIGIMTIFLPYLFGSLYAACAIKTLPPRLPSSVLGTSLLLFIASFLLRSAGCAWNDIIDRDLDAKVPRCRLRPMVRGAISPRNAYIFTAVQGILWLGVLAAISMSLLRYTIPLIGLVIFYPFAKRVTHFPQVVLGVTLAWGVLIGYEAGMVHFRPLHESGSAPTSSRVGLLCLGLSYVIWTVIHDTIYGALDTVDDIKAGIKSMAVYYRYSTKPLLSALGALQVVLHIMTGLMMAAWRGYYAGTCAGIAAVIAVMIWKVEWSKPESCWWWFTIGCLAFGATVTAGLAADLYKGYKG
ncbi:Para-hydroxybenzoate--polyprenyltransferase, mitochondrial precursor (PHB:polyprenyltransferase) [Trapelia coarctata]|nr:Para-hydroxybenzoate--polyprenyltransferase, mitochondrial precursor (PHB:polyprenyltransferase) [Trapelia coarctata]